MKNQHLPELSTYYNEISKFLPCKAGIKKSFICDLKERVSVFFEVHTDANMADVLEHFGRPEEIAATFLESLCPKDIKKVMSLKKVIITGFVTVLAFLLVYLVLSFIDGTRSSRGYLVEGAAYEHTYQQN